MALVAEGDVELPQGRYAIRTISDDGIRVFVDEKPVIDRWTEHESALDAAPLTAGRHHLRVEYFELTGFAELRVEIIKSRNQPPHHQCGKARNHQGTTPRQHRYFSRAGLDDIECRSHCWKQRGSRLGQLNSAIEASKQRNTEMTFERFDLAADCAVGQVQLFGRRAEAHLPRSNFESRERLEWREAAFQDQLLRVRFSQQCMTKHRLLSALSRASCEEMSSLPSFFRLARRGDCLYQVAKLER